MLPSREQPPFGFGTPGPDHDFTMGAVESQCYDDTESEHVKRGKGKQCISAERQTSSKRRSA
jgi:hypothetical protein